MGGSYHLTKHTVRYGTATIINGVRHTDAELCHPNLGVIDISEDLASKIIEDIDLHRKADLMTYAVYILQILIFVSLWLAYNSDNPSASGSDVAGEGMSRGFQELGSITFGLITVILSLIAVKCKTGEIRATAFILNIVIAMIAIKYIGVIE